MKKDSIQKVVQRLAADYGFEIIGLYESDNDAYGRYRIIYRMENQFVEAATNSDGEGLFVRNYDGSWWQMIGTCQFKATGKINFRNQIVRKIAHSHYDK